MYSKREKVMDKVDTNEMKGREHFKEDLGKWYIMAFSKKKSSREDGWMTARTDYNRTYICEIKNYEDPENPRPYTKYVKHGVDYGYQIDYDKIDYLVTKGMETNRIPILYARFDDMTYVWDLTYIPYEERKKLKKTNKHGYAYGEKETSWQTYLYRDEAIWSKPTTT